MKNVAKTEKPIIKGEIICIDNSTNSKIEDQMITLEKFDLYYGDIQHDVK